MLCRNEQGKRKHPEFAGLPVCRECFDLLGAAAWHLEGDWKDEGGSDKYCRFCASSAPGGTSTLMHCGKPGCNKGFCTGYAAAPHLCKCMDGATACVCGAPLCASCPDCTTDRTEWSQLSIYVSALHLLQQEVLNRGVSTCGAVHSSSPPQASGLGHPYWVLS